MRHGIAFEDAVGIFAGPTLERVDDRMDYGETRIYAIGVVNGSGDHGDLHGRLREATPEHFGKKGGTT